jgi:hypothetical protein
MKQGIGPEAVSVQAWEGGTTLDSCVSSYDIETVDGTLLPLAAVTSGIWVDGRSAVIASGI